MLMKLAKNLTQQPPRSPRARLGGYAILARMADKGRATLAGTAGEYHFACPLDQMLFGFKAVQAEEVKKLLAADSSDEQIVAWFGKFGAKKTAEEIEAWSKGVEAIAPYQDPKRKDWFAGECARLGLAPEATTLFDYLEADDDATVKN
jgi:Domain of unknown function (DUF5069)